MVNKAELEMTISLVNTINQYREWVSFGNSPLFTEDGAIKLIEVGAPIFAAVTRTMRESQNFPIGFPRIEWFERIAATGWGKDKDQGISWVLNQSHLKNAAEAGLRMYEEGFTGDIG